MSRYTKIENDTRLMKNAKVKEQYLELEGICRGVVCTQGIGVQYSYEGILQRANGELLEFTGAGRRLEGALAKASSEMEMPVTVQGFFTKYPLLFSVHGLKLGDIKSERYEE
ncbi:MAG: hypothetical protein WC852_02000 [Candidatus Nanoarchaeia archaeon]|jgi:hypothetical protein